MRRTVLTAIALTAVLATGAHAQSGLGSLTQQAQIANKNFDIADKNKDGVLTKEEAEKGPVPFIRAHFDAIDKDHKGTVSKQDVVDYVKSLQQGHRHPATAASTH